MNRPLFVQEKKAKKQTKITKKKPIKVVYINNPMRVKTTASEFRALVQELTGQNAIVPEPEAFSPDNGITLDEDEIPQVPRMEKVDSDEEVKGFDDHKFGAYNDEVIFEDLSVFLPSSLMFESSCSHVDRLIKSLDAV